MKAAVSVMRFALKNDITKEDGWVSLDIEAPPPPGSAPDYKDTVKGRIVLTNAGEAITAEGWLHTTATMQCSRCAKLHSVDIRITVAEECVLEELDSPEAYMGGESDDSPIPILNGDEIDLSELVRQLLNLYLPPRSLCMPDCKGLCATCGQDLNEGTCDCAGTQIDPRLAALADLQLDTDSDD